MDAHEIRSERLALVITPAQKRQIEAVRLELAKRGRQASLSAVAVALIEQALHTPAPSWSTTNF
jgi:hypothetical protein